MGPRTLRARLVLAAAGSIVAAVALFAVVTVVLVRRELRGSLDNALVQRAETVAELAVSAPAVLTEPGALESDASGRQIVVEVTDRTGRILARSLTLGARLLPEDRVSRAALASGQTGFEDVSIEDRRFRLYAAPIAAGVGGPASGGVVLVASDTSDISRTLGHLGLVVALVGVVIAALAVLASFVLTRRGLAPLRRLADAAGEIERTADPSRRLPAADPLDEIGRLTGVLNRMLAALEAARDTERRFLADASHELRTPVTTLIGNVEYAARHGADPEVLADLRRDAARLGRLVDDLLVVERSGRGEDRRQAVQLDDLVRRVLSAHHELNGRLEVGPLTPARVDGDPDALARVLDNLISNAILHGPRGGKVTVALRRGGGGGGGAGGGGWVLLSVGDEGPGPAAGDRERLFERFWRAPEAAERPGSGLGLAIVATITQRHGGSVSVDGSTFTVALPVADGPEGTSRGP